MKPLRSIYLQLLLVATPCVITLSCGGSGQVYGGVEDQAVESIALREKPATRWRAKMTPKRSERCHKVRDQVLAQARKIGVDPHTMLAIAWVESGFSLTARSHAGAVGLMQLLPHISVAFGCESPRRPRCAARAAAKLFARLLARFDGHVVYALCAYNAGAGRIKKAYQQGKTPFNYGYAQRVLLARKKLLASGCAAR